MVAKSKISKGKRNNQQLNKLVKKGVVKSKKPKKHVQKTPKIVQPIPEYDESESDHGEDMLGMVEDDDLEFLKNAIINKSYTLLSKVRYTEPTNNKGKKRKIDETVDDNTLEQDYEDKPVTTVNLKSLLPIKTKTGVVRRTVEREETEEIDEEPEEENLGEDDSDDGEFTLDDSTFDISKPVTSAQLLATRSEKLQEKKMHIGTLSSGLLENPEEKVTNFRTLLKILDDETPEVYTSIRKLAIVSLLEVFKDLLPSYQIKLQEIDGVKLKKDTLKLHKYEENILQYYKKYLQKLEKFASVLYKKRGDTRIRTQGDKKLGEIAVHAMCDLLVVHPYFNYAQNIAQAVVPFLNNPNKSVRVLVAAAVKTVFKEDKKEEITLQIMRVFNQYLKTHAHNINPDMLDILLALRIKEVNLDHEKEQELKQKKFMSKKNNILSLSKKEKKRKKRLSELENEMMETKAEENKQTKQKNMTEITKLLFGIYFRILKNSSNTKVLGVCLEGLAKYSHCINLDYYVDIVKVLDNLLKEDWLGYREKLHCIQTVFSILSGQGEAINMDPTRFYNNLYKDLLTTHASKTHVNFIIVLHTVVDGIIKRRKKITNKRIIGFLKRLATLSLQLLHNGALGCLGVIKTALQLNKAADILLDLDTSCGDGEYNAELLDPEYCGASSTSLFEIALLSNHYHPIVSKYAKHIARGVPATGEGSLPPLYGKCTPAELYTDFDMTQMAFNPSIQIPRKAQPKTRPNRHQFADDRFKKMCYHRVKMHSRSYSTCYYNC